jgi:hypothetical protein
MDRGSSLVRVHLTMGVAMIRRSILALAAALVAACGSSGSGVVADPVSSSAVDPGNAGGNKFVTVMSRNLYLGGGVEAFFDPRVTVTMIPGLAAELWATVQATDFPSRARAIADEIEEAGPALVGLQEASLFRTQAPGDAYLPAGSLPATQVAYDFVEILLDELAARGLAYHAVAVRENIDVEVFTVPGFIDVRLTDRDAILARDDVNVMAVDGATFAASISIPLGGAGGPRISVIRGWQSALVKIQGVELVFANTHLEPFSPIIQGLQAQELLGVFAGTTRPVILVGDLNSHPGPASDPGAATYRLFAGAGWVDAFGALHPGVDGFTCCQAEDLRNATSLLDSRVDHVFLRGALTPRTAQIVGADPEDRTPGGLWPSDHAGVVSRVRLENPKFFALKGK